ncbi:MAG: filamentous hemagglutinin N-terminal domain-containing protein [Rhodocyclales bacterium]|nr:filamentous hemagglutinin N-terminal domain-containing protein [Rhodocyclales bacterium]
MKPVSVLRTLFAIAVPAGAWAQAGLPTGANVVAGSATFANTANSMTVNTGSQRTVINYNTFNVGAGNSVIFNQPSSSSATLNRVLGADISTIHGSVTSNGQIFLVNPSGIFVGPAGSFSGSSVYLSTGNISNADFLGGNIRFDPPPSGSTIRMDGRIDAMDDLRHSADRLEVTGVLQVDSGSIILDQVSVVEPPPPPIVPVTPPLLPGTGTITVSGAGSGGNLSLSGGGIALLPHPGVVAAGSVSFVSGTTGLTVTNSNGAIINWNSFNIAAGQTTHFQQSSASSIVLNRVTGADPATILGHLTSNGKVFLVNPAGTIVGPGTAVPVGSMKLASASIRTPNPVAAPAPPPPPAARPVAPSLPRGTSGLVDGTVTVRLSLVDAAPISLR